MVCDDKRKIIAYLWYLNALLSIAYVIVAIAAAANQEDLETATTNHAAGFAAIWSMLILFLIIIGGTITMKRVRVVVEGKGGKRGGSRSSGIGLG